MENYIINGYSLGHFYKKKFLANIGYSSGHFYNKNLWETFLKNLFSQI